MWPTLQPMFSGHMTFNAGRRAQGSGHTVSVKSLATCMAYPVYQCLPSTCTATNASRLTNSHLGITEGNELGPSVSPSSPVDEDELLVSVNSSSLDSRSKGPRDVGPSGGAGSVLGGSVTGVAVWLEEASSWLAVGSSLSSSACREGLHPAFSHLDSSPRIPTGQ